jgi:hypothetical protein
MKVCYTALFGNYENLKEPIFTTPGWKYICYTDQDLSSNVWEIKKVSLNGFNPQLLARYFKIMEWVDWEQSIWIDASFVIATDLNLWWEKHFKGGLTVPAHPLRNCVYVECLDCIISKRGNKEQVQAQMAEYRTLQIPERNGIIQSGLLMRENTPEVIKLCEAWYREVSTHSVRDQIAFAKVSIPFKEIVHLYNWDYRQERDFIYKKHYHLR